MTKTAYLTIDDAPSADFLNKLDFLDAKGIAAVWFCQGNHMERRPQMIIEAIRRGHIVGNHSYTHPQFSELSLDQACAEIRSTDAILEELYHRAGVARRHRFFRFPYGDKGTGTSDNAFAVPDEDGKRHHDAIQAYLRGLGYTQPVFPGLTYAYFYEAGLHTDVDWYWTYDTIDWAFAVDSPPYGIDSIDKMKARMDENAPDEGRGLNDPASAEIILMHDHEPPAPVFVSLIDYLLAKGIRFRRPVPSTGATI